MTPIRLNHVICDVYWQILSDLSCQGICVVQGAVCLAKFQCHTDVHDKQRYILGVLLGHYRAQPCQLMDSQQWRAEVW